MFFGRSRFSQLACAGIRERPSVSCWGEGLSGMALDIIQPVKTTEKAGVSFSAAYERRYYEKQFAA